MIKIFIIYIDADYRANLVQEKNLFQSTPSKRFWKYFFEKMGYSDFMFYLLPHNFKNEIERKNWLRDLDKTIQDFSNSKSKIALKIIITGDHDEKAIKVLKRREKIANEIKTKHSNLNTTIILERNPKFKIELIISEIIGARVNKNFLSEKIGNKYPTIDYLFEFLNFEKLENAYEIIAQRLEKSEHPLFREITKTKKQKQKNKINY